MSSTDDICRGRKWLRPLVEFAVREGWQLSRTAGGHLTLVKPGIPPIFTSFTASDHRAGQNAKAWLRRAGHNTAGGCHG